MSEPNELKYDEFYGWFEAAMESAYDFKKNSRLRGRRLAFGELKKYYLAKLRSHLSPAPAQAPKDLAMRTFTEDELLDPRHE